MALNKEKEMVIKQVITEDYAVYNGDSMEVIPELIEDKSIHLSVYSPPFFDLYQYSSSPRDMSNCKSYEGFMENYEFLVKEISRITMPGRHSIVHCMDIPIKGGNGFIDYPGDIISMHAKHDLVYSGRRCVWKEPYRIARRTMSIGLKHAQVIKDASICNVAGADYILDFRKKGDSDPPISHSKGFSEYSGSNPPPQDLVDKYSGWEDNRTNRLSHWIFRHLASSVWMDINIDSVLAYKAARGSDEEKHVCPLQLDVIDRCIDYWSNPGEIVLTPFMGVGSEVYSAISKGRRGIGIELKETYFNQAIRNLKHAKDRYLKTQGDLFAKENSDTEPASTHKFRTCKRKEEINYKEGGIKLNHCNLGWDLTMSVEEKVDRCNRCFYYSAN